MESDTMCLMVRILYKFNTLEAFERAVRTIECNWGDKLIKGRVAYNNYKIKLTWSNLFTELSAAKSQNPAKIHGLIAVENQ
ncbi:MAG: hypothetical protein PVG65_00765 [Candidatus Thorarchaeota archaeon]|jgi:hypothetical protein